MTEVRENVGPTEEAAERMRKTILVELEAILTSPIFRGSERCKQFLEYVVTHHLNGHPELLKERTIGTELFGRPPGYATGEDPVVRVQAGQVRHRLEQYYQTTPTKPKLRIELPLGTYSPSFQWNTAEPVEKLPAAESPAPAPPQAPKSRWRHPMVWAFVAALLLLAAAVGFVQTSMRQARLQKDTLGQFWAPVFASQQPVLICLTKPVVYRPTQDLYRKYARQHPGAYTNEVERTTQPLAMRSDESVQWGDMYDAKDYGVAVGDAYAAVDLSGLLGRIGKPSQVRIGSNYSFEDLRNSPAILVGAFNNGWTMQMMTNLHFSFTEEHEDFSIREAAPGSRIWRPRANARGQLAEDYALIGRILDSKTGQFTVFIAGITSAGTQAAGDLISNPISLERALHSLPANWQSKNLELVLEIPVTDSVPSPARVVASYSW